MIKPYYKFWNERCYRTVKNQYPDVKLTRTGTYHNALDDARTQAEHLVQICQNSWIGSFSNGCETSPGPSVELQSVR
jgi:inhibitor of KinA sporulation pathway (predicted exonuclease)